MMDCALWNILRRAVAAGASDVHLDGTFPPVVRLQGELRPLEPHPPEAHNPETRPAAPCPEGLKIAEAAQGRKEDWQMEELFRPVLSERHCAQLQEKGECDLACQLPEGQRFRINLFRNGGSLSASIRVIPDTVPVCETLGLPASVRAFATLARGLVLITGATGSGKSTTLAAILNEINTTRRVHILTLEDPVEYRFTPVCSLIHQREVGRDTCSFASGLRAALREDPDVIMVGELRDEETMATALTAAETGHLVFGTLHTAGAVDTVHRILDVFPDREQQIRAQLAASLAAVVSQKLLPRRDGRGRVGAYEVLIMTAALRNLIREGHTQQIRSFMQTGSRLGMQTMEQAVEMLQRTGKI